MADLAPKVPNLNPQVPETAHPETTASQFPNINEAPDRPSDVHGKSEIAELEKSLEQDGEEHVRQAIGKITGTVPAKTEEKQTKDQADKEKRAAEASKPKAGGAGKPLQLTPPPSDKPS